MDRRERVGHIVDAITKQLIDEGKIIEAGFESYRLTVMPSNAGQVQRDETRMAFFAGAQHLFGTIVNTLDPGLEETEADLNRMDKIDAELRAFLVEFKRKHGLD